jgi:predicted membrane-bound mannosyltransferase
MGRTFYSGKFVLQAIVVHPDFELQRDEFLHLDQPDHLAWSYLSVPPLTSWISVLISWLGNTVFWIRFFPALFGVFTLILIWDLVGRLGGNLFVKSLAAVCMLCTYSAEYPLPTQFYRYSLIHTRILYDDSAHTNR